MLYICIPAHNEAPTIGLLLWRIRKVFDEFSREYEIVVLDDGSTDTTAETLRPYPEVLPLTVMRNERAAGYAAALDTLARTVSQRTRYPRRDAAVFMQADFTDQPESLPEMVKLFEGGADLVVAEQTTTPAGTPTGVRRLRRVARWLSRFAAPVEGLSDPLGSYRLIRIAVLRDMIKEAGNAPLVTGEGWAVNAAFLRSAMRHARRLETVPVVARYDVRQRPSRVRSFAGAVELYRLGRDRRARRVSAGT
ncbi:MAG TPA: glycosyltransferase family 2 protein [Gemmatimonadaceae bacterium]|nr:glycosyltransferase family 2 protein [Gemmatimonadaceae bacterium]